jgi:hypothetical protein
MRPNGSFIGQTNVIHGFTTSGIYPILDLFQGQTTKYYNPKAKGWPDLVLPGSGSGQEYNGDYLLTYFYGSGTYTVVSGTTVDILMVGGGGGGGSGSSVPVQGQFVGSGGGGGAGGAYLFENVYLPTDTYTITIGGGGVGGVFPVANGFSRGSNGGDTIIESGDPANLPDGGIMTMPGGGGGGGSAPPGQTPLIGRVGGSGGGGADGQAGGLGLPPYGNPGGASAIVPPPNNPAYDNIARSGYKMQGGGGGGGAGTAGQDATITRGNEVQAGYGGNSQAWDKTGSVRFYAGGGGGGLHHRGSYNNDAYTGGLTVPQGGYWSGGAGGMKFTYNTSPDLDSSIYLPQNANAHTGGGGGGGFVYYTSVYPAGNGASGAVIIVANMPPEAGTKGVGSGGTYTIDKNGYRYHVFSNSNVFSVSGNTLKADILIVAGGGGGGAYAGPGGGAGGTVWLEQYELRRANYTMVVGAGGKGEPYNSSHGNPSYILGPSDWISISGGGAGQTNIWGRYRAALSDGASGAGGYVFGGYRGPAGHGIPGLGNDGSQYGTYTAGGGGGASSAATSDGYGGAGIYLEALADAGIGAKGPPLLNWGGSNYSVVVNVPDTPNTPFFRKRDWFITDAERSTGTDATIYFPYAQPYWVTYYNELYWNQGYNSRYDERGWQLSSIIPPDSAYFDNWQHHHLDLGPADWLHNGSAWTAEFWIYPLALNAGNQVIFSNTQVAYSKDQYSNGVMVENVTSGDNQFIIFNLYSVYDRYRPGPYYRYRVSQRGIYYYEAVQGWRHVVIQADMPNYTVRVWVNGKESVYNKNGPYIQQQTQPLNAQTWFYDVGRSGTFNWQWQFSQDSSLQNLWLGSTVYLHDYLGYGLPPYNYHRQLVEAYKFTGYISNFKIYSYPKYSTSTINLPSSSVYDADLIQITPDNAGAGALAYSPFNNDTYNFSDQMTDVTIELWFYCDNFADPYMQEGFLFSTQETVEVAGTLYGGGLLPVLAASVNNYGQVVFYVMGQKTPEFELTFLPQIATESDWNHIAMVRHQGLWTFYINGVDYQKKKKYNSRGDYYSNTALISHYVSLDEDRTISSGGNKGFYKRHLQFILGGTSDEINRPVHQFRGYLNNFRVVKGTAVYTTDFFPAKHNLENINGTIILAARDNSTDGKGCIANLARSDVPFYGNYVTNFTQINPEDSTPVKYVGGGGGGGSLYAGQAGKGGVGGGGYGSPTSQHRNGLPNTGGGGGGGGYGQSGGDGGSGLILIRYPLGAAGGGNVSSSGIYTVHVFNSSDIFRLFQDLTVDILVVAGGGAGGYSGYGGGGGGGAGGLLYETGVNLSKGKYQVLIGAGGVGSTSIQQNSGTNGSVTIFADMYTCIGGGYGGNGGGARLPASGGSGGGAAGNYYTTYSGGAGTTDQGNAGGSSLIYGAGGGGAGEPGGDTTDGSEGQGKGGDGLAFDITGTMTYYAGGGAGSLSGADGVGGQGGGADSFAGDLGNGWNGAANTGGGGSGDGGNASGGNGGSGVVIIRYITV